MSRKPKYEIGQEAHRVCVHGDATIEDVTIEGVWSHRTEASEEFYYDVFGYDERGDPEHREQVRESLLLETEEDAWKKLLSQLRGDLASAKHEVWCIERKLEQVKDIMTRKGYKI